MLVRPTIGDSSWFVRDRFGLFVHWGLYALPARHEWVKQVERLSDDHYRRYFERFDPDLYEPAAWAEAAHGAGMRYAVITTKHHEGFCLWDSGLTDYKSTNTPAGRDLLTPFVDAFRNRGMRVGFYHSLIDWHHPGFVVDDMHPQRGERDRDALNAGRDQRRYAAYLHGQVRELLTGFGDISVMWLDFTYPSTEGRQGKGPDDWDAERLVKMARDLQPGILVNNRAGLADDWDFQTPEQVQPPAWIEVDGQRVVWEACQTFSGSWGYHRDEASWKSTGQLIRMLIDTVSKGGNLLLNVGPTGRGTFDERALDRLRGIGRWMRLHSRAIYGCTEAPFVAPPDSRMTYDPERGRLYVHCFAWPTRELRLDGLAGKVSYAQLLNDASELRTRDRDGSLVIALPAREPDTDVPVIELFLK
jgi:alpha-L-fucosidase